MLQEALKAGWCLKCADATWVKGEAAFVCHKCGEALREREQLGVVERKCFDFLCWMEKLSMSGAMGLSPRDSAQELGCDRSMIDKLVEAKILERSVYDQDGFHVVVISLSSIYRALENKRRTGKWTGSGRDKIGGAWQGFGKGVSE